MISKSLDNLKLNDVVKSDIQDGMSYIVIGIARGLICLKYLGLDENTMPFIITDLQRLKLAKFYIIK